MIQFEYYKEDRDFGNIYRIFTNDEVGANIITRPDRRDEKSFKHWFDEMLDRSFHDFLVYYEGNTFVGIAYSYNYRHIDGHCHVSVAVTPEMKMTGAGSEVARQILDRMFNSYPLRKVFMEIYAHNRESIKAAKEAGLRHEATLGDYHFCKGAYEDMEIYSLTRSDYLHIMELL